MLVVYLCLLYRDGPKKQIAQFAKDSPAHLFTMYTVEIYMPDPLKICEFQAMIGHKKDF
jgi:hypothetical protein